MTWNISTAGRGELKEENWENHNQSKTIQLKMSPTRMMKNIKNQELWRIMTRHELLLVMIAGDDVAVRSVINIITLGTRVFVNIHLVQGCCFTCLVNMIAVTAQCCFPWWKKMCMLPWGKKDLFRDKVKWMETLLSCFSGQWLTAEMPALRLADPM